MQIHCCWADPEVYSAIIPLKTQTSAIIEQYGEFGPKLNLQQHPNPYHKNQRDYFEMPFKHRSRSPCLYSTPMPMHFHHKTCVTIEFLFPFARNFQILAYTLMWKDLCFIQTIQGVSEESICRGKKDDLEEHEKA